MTAEAIFPKASALFMIAAFESMMAFSENSQETGLLQQFLISSLLHQLWRGVKSMGLSR